MLKFFVSDTTEMLCLLHTLKLIFLECSSGLRTNWNHIKEVMYKRLLYREDELLET